MRIDPQFVQGLVGALNQNTAHEQQYTTEMSTGVIVNSLSDNPVAAGQDYLLRSTASVNDNFVQTAGGVQSMLQVTDTALGSVVTQITQAISLATEGNNGTLNSSNLQSISNQLSGIRSEIMSLANTSYQGQFLFSGSQTSTQPFSLDNSTTPETVIYSGDSARETLQSPTGQKFSTNLPGDQIFGSGSSGILATLSNLIAEFSSGVTGGASVSNAAALNSGLQSISNQRVVLDNSLTSLQSSSTYAQTQTAQLQAAQDALIQTNPTKIATELSATETQHTALIDMIGSLDQQPTLFDVLR
ncbi:MAG: flagellar hook-associated protein 3 [Acidobacteriaceae bacterium]